MLCSMSVVVHVQGKQPYVGLATTACGQTGNSNSIFVDFQVCKASWKFWSQPVLEDGTP